MLLKEKKLNIIFMFDILFFILFRYREKRCVYLSIWFFKEVIYIRDILLNYEYRIFLICYYSFWLVW